MSRLKTHPITHYEFDDLVNALGTERKDIVKICGGIKKDAIGWWRFKQRIPVVHLERLANELEKKLKGRKDLNPVEQRALAFVRLALASGSAVPLTAQSPFAASFGVDAGASRTKSKRAGLTGLSAIPLEDLIAEIRRRGGSVTFDGRKSKKSK